MGQHTMKILLIVSLGINFLIGGMVVSRVLAHRQALPPHHGMMDMSLRQLTKALPDDAKAVVRREMRGQRAAFHPIFEEIRASYTHLNAVLAADDFDETALRQAFDETAALQAKLLVPAHDALVRAAASMSAENRKALAAFGQKMEERHRRMGDRWRDKSDKDDADRQTRMEQRRSDLEATVRGDYEAEIAALKAELETLKALGEDAEK